MIQQILLFFIVFLVLICLFSSRSKPPKTPLSSNDKVNKLYQTYYKSKGVKPSTPQQLLQYGKEINIDVKWAEINKFMKNNQNYLDSLITDDKLQNVAVPDAHKPNMFTPSIPKTTLSNSSKSKPESVSDTKPIENQENISKQPCVGQSVLTNRVKSKSHSTTIRYRANTTNYGMNCNENNTTIPPKKASSIVSRTKPKTNKAAVCSNDNVIKLYQIYYKCKGVKPSTPQQLLQYGKYINISVKWSEVNKLMKNDVNYLNSLITDDKLQNVAVSKIDKANTSTKSRINKPSSSDNSMTMSESFRCTSSAKPSKVTKYRRKTIENEAVSSPKHVNASHDVQKNKIITGDKIQSIIVPKVDKSKMSTESTINKLSPNNNSIAMSESFRCTSPAKPSITTNEAVAKIDKANMSIASRKSKPSSNNNSITMSESLGCASPAKPSKVTKYKTKTSKNEVISSPKHADESHHEQKNRATTDDDNVRNLYQIYYKAKDMKATSAQQLIKYGKSVNINIKWVDANKLMKKSKLYLNSLITDEAMQNVIVPQIQKEATIRIKVEASMSEYYWIKDLTVHSTISDICDKLESRLLEASIKINLYKDNEPLPRSETVQQLGLKDGDSLYLGVHNTSTGIDSFLEASLAKKQYYQKFQSLSNVDKDNKADLMDKYTDNILNNAPSGNVSNRDTLLHVMSGLAESNGQKCVFFNSDKNIVPQDEIERNSHLHIIEANDNKDKTFVLTLKSLKNTEEKNENVTEEEIFEMQKCIESNKATSHPLLNDIKSKLSRVHNVLESRIQIIGVFVGSFNLEYTISDLTVNEIQKMKENAMETQNKMDELFDDFQRLNMHPILFRQTYDIAMFDQAGNKTFRKKKTFQVGKDKNGKSETYTQPFGWTRYGLNVLNKYDDGNAWLHPFGDENNWYRAFHGTRRGGKGGAAVDAMSGIYKEGFRISYNDRRNGTRATYGDGVYMSANPEYVENRYAAKIDMDTENGKKTFKFMLMVAVRPDAVIRDREDERHRIWHAPHPKDVRPYGILIKECTY